MCVCVCDRRVGWWGWGEGSCCTYVKVGGEGSSVCSLQMALSDRHWEGSLAGPRDEVISTPRKRAGPVAKRRIRSQEMGPGRAASLDPPAENIARAGQAEGASVDDAVENSDGDG